mmetsp:Transcript_55976/g.89100  ORF Transcript_55976/g.89100 Transcript_55976/m.89100 type:complete len:282 (-) Transcript_55976:204-1049(-)
MFQHLASKIMAIHEFLLAAHKPYLCCFRPVFQRFAFEIASESPSVPLFTSRSHILSKFRLDHVPGIGRHSGFMPVRIERDIRLIVKVIDTAMQCLMRHIVLLLARVVPPIVFVLVSVRQRRPIFGQLILLCFFIFLPMLEVCRVLFDLILDEATRIPAFRWMLIGQFLLFPLIVATLFVFVFVVATEHRIGNHIRFKRRSFTVRVNGGAVVQAFNVRQRRLNVSVGVLRICRVDLLWLHWRHVDIVSFVLWRQVYTVFLLQSGRCVVVDPVDGLRKVFRFV